MLPICAPTPLAAAPAADAGCAPLETGADCAGACGHPADVGPKLSSKFGNTLNLPRRAGSHLAAGITASAVMTVSDHALAQPAAAARVRGPLVWLDMDQKELDDAYD